MKINLYYVEGISRIDTPSFNTKTHTGTIEDQEEFFLTKLVKSIDTAFYPPYYQNEIKFDASDLVITDNVNYLSLEYNGKTYYYFIDKINYTSTGIILLEVSMDTIQTFMFDIYISSGIIERKFINRWINTNEINRTYKRENLSNNLYELYHHYELPMNEREFVVVAKKAQIVDSQLTVGDTTITVSGINSKKVIYPSEVRFCPYYDTTIEIGNESHNTILSYFVQMMCKDAHTSELFLIPFKCLGSINYEASKWAISDNDYQFPRLNQEDHLWFMPKSIVGDFYFEDVFPSAHNYASYSFEFSKNISKNVVFNSQYMPVMLDENYIRIIFGSRSSNTSFPLYKLNNIFIYYCWYADVLNGSRYYYLSTEPYKDNYRTLCADYEPIKLDLISDAYAQFNATNKYRWLEAIGKTAITAASLFISVYAGAAFAAADIAAIAATSLTPKRRKLSKKGQRAIKAIERSQEIKGIEAIDKGVDAVTPIGDTLIREMNMCYSPDSIKQAGFTADITSISYQIFRDIEKVNDYEQCAQYYHRNGYLVQEYITQVSNIFLSVRNRYYFDMLKMSIPEVHLHNVIEDEETVGLIEERLETGLRLWNVKNSDVIIGDFTYDNVELDYLS